MNGAHIGANSLVAAGALVTEGTQVPEGSLVVGVPAKVRRALTEEEIAGNREAAEGYAAIGRDLAEQGILQHPRRRAHHRSRPGLASAALPVSP